MAQTFNGKPGDLIEINHGAYQHWAVYIGNNEVVHLVNEGGDSSGWFKSLSSSSGSHGKVKREKLTDVVKGHRYHVNNMLDKIKNACDPSIIVKEACAMVGRELPYIGVTYNCEHFATEMRYGKAESRQFKGKPGDLIEIFRGPYKQWAVYIGENEVVHFTTDGGDSSGSFEGLSSSTGNVKRERFADVVGIHRNRINNLLDNSRKARDPSIIVKEACAMVGRELPYNLVTYNCEHFATEMRYDKAESWQLRGIPGDLIEINRGSYQQWAVYIGENEVIHLVNEGGQSSGSSANPGSITGKVKRDKLADLVGNDRCHVNNLLDDMYEDRKLPIIVKEACAMVGSELPYNLVTYNCEHFATEMRYGKAVSWQFKGKPGDLIEINRGPYKQWAVYIGENEVVHLVHEGGQSSGSFEHPSSRAEVKREKLADVVGHHSCRVNNLLDEEYKARQPSVIVKEACAMVGRKLPYDVVTYNCEHFATEMRYDKPESRQFIGKPGDLIEIFRGFYQHWAVYIGENEVVHLVPDGVQSSGWFTSLSSMNGKVHLEKLSDVVGNHRYQVNNLLDDRRTPRDPSIIVMEACAMVGRELQYNVVTYNSEHFATEMRYGKAKSRQVKAAVVTGAAAGAVAAVATAAAAVTTGLTAGAHIVAAVFVNLLGMPLLFHKPASTLFNGKPGDLIEINRGPYKHWAVYIGENEVVMLVNEGVQSSGWFTRPSSRGEVKREKLANLLGLKGYLVNNLQDKEYEARDPSVIVKEACAMVGRELQYNSDTYNSEHFASEMRYGKAESRQFKGKPGDLIEINRGLYKHWAVYIGENEVVHFTTDGGQSSGWFTSLSSSPGKVKREKLAEVVGNHRCCANNLLDNRRPGALRTARSARYGSGGAAREPSVIVEEACAMVGRELQYNAATYNCEHFANEMRYGVAESRQFKGKPGDLIEIFCWGYQHWAVYIGENEVVHLVNEGVQSSGWFRNLSRSTGKVKREKLANLLILKSYRVKHLQDEEYDAREPSVIVEEACAMVGRVLNYDLVSYNCEHFAIEMRYGKAESRQFKGNKGDLIEISHRDHKQWAVYIGENEVVHLVKDGVQSSGWLENPGSSNGKVKREKFADVVGNHRCQVNNLLDNSRNSRDPSVIVKEACKMVDRKLPYDVATYNCKHFATDLRYGKEEYWQVFIAAVISYVITIVFTRVAAVAREYAVTVCVAATVVAGIIYLCTALFSG